MNTKKKLELKKNEVEVDNVADLKRNLRNLKKNIVGAEVDQEIIRKNIRNKVAEVKAKKEKNVLRAQKEKNDLIVQIKKNDLEAEKGEMIKID